MTKKQNETVKGYKGFDKDLKCRDFQFEVGKSYEHESDIKLCESGFHFCEHPLNVLNFYPLRNGNKFAEIEATGNVKYEDNGSKSVTSKINIKAQLDLPAFIKAAIDFTWDKASKGGIFKKSNATSGYGAHSATSGEYANSATSGEYANSATSGNRAHSATSGNRANSATSGYGAHSATTTSDAIACAVGRKAKAKASLGAWIVIAEWEEGKEWTDAKPKCVLTGQVDGKKIKADQWYKIVNNKFVETDDSNE